MSGGIPNIQQKGTKYPYVDKWNYEWDSYN